MFLTGVNAKIQSPYSVMLDELLYPEYIVGYS